MRRPIKLRSPVTLRSPIVPERGRGPSDWMCTASGVKYYPAAPRVEDVRILDIAHHLSRICRYTGAVHTEHYSVAEHSVHVSNLVPAEHALAGLMHDAAEAYLNDMNRPAKQHMPDYQRMEELNWAVIAEKFGLPLELHPCVKEADTAMLYPERLALMPVMDDWPVLKGIKPPTQITILALNPNAARDLFMRRFYELTSGYGFVGRCYPPPARPLICAHAVPA